MIKDIQSQLRDLVEKIIIKPDACIIESGDLVILSEEDKKYASLISMFYTVIEDGKIDDLDRAFKKTFPEYYDRNKA